MNLIENHQLVPVTGKVVGWVRQLGQIRRMFQIEIKRSGFPGDFECQGGFAHLPGPQHGESGKLVKQFLGLGLDGARNRPCKGGSILRNFKDAL